MVRILLVDSDPGFHRTMALHLLGGSRAHLCAVADRFSEGLRLAAARAHDVVLLGASEEVGQTVQHLQALRIQTGDQRVLVALTLAEPAELQALLQAGADGCLLKTDPWSDWLEAFDAINRRELFVSASLTPGLFQHLLQATHALPGTGLDGPANRDRVRRHPPEAP